MSRSKPDNPIAEAQVFNRLSAFTLHTTRYAFEGMARLAEDAGISPSAISRLVRGERRPAYFLITRIIAALEQDLGVTIDPREVFREDPHFPTKYPCTVAGCRGCTPPWFYDEDGVAKPEYSGISPGKWEARLNTSIHVD